MTQGALLSLFPDMPAQLGAILDPARGAFQSPIRSEIFGPQRFAQHGRSLGLTHRAERARLGTATFVPRLNDNIAALREAYRYIGVQASSGYDISPAAEWLLDNFHLIEAQLKEIHEGLPRSYFRTLPMLIDEPLAGLPRIYGVAWAFVAHTDGGFDEDLLIPFLDAYQESRELKLSEMWALPTTLRVVLIENLRRLSERVATNKAARELANLCFDRIEKFSVTQLDQLLTLLNQRGVGRVFLAQMAQRVQDGRGSGEGGEQPAFQTWLNLALPDLAAMQSQQSADQAADNLSVSNAVKSLRAIGDADWSDIIARASVMMRLLLQSPGFKAEAASTRDQTLHAIELLAKRSGRGEVAVAQTLLDLMQASTDPDSADSMASHWLRGSGRPALLRALGLHERTARVWQIARKWLALPAYLGVLLTSSVVVLWLLLRHAGASGTDAATWLAALLMIFPVSEAVIAVINRLISESAQPQHLPRLALLDGIPAAHRVMVVIPAMLTSPASTAALVHRLHLHYLANPEQEAQFALLTDWADADSAHCDADGPLLEQARRSIDKLNARYCAGVGVAGAGALAPRFIVLHRERQFCETEQRWIGWERKRGKLERLVAALATGENADFINLGSTSRIAAQIQYIVTLDSDTQLPTGRLRDLVGVAAHPHNQPRLHEDGSGVLSGYGILQPRVATPLPAPHCFTPYHWLFAGQCGIDPYSAATSEVYQDLFLEGTFTGKGLLNVRAMHAVLSGRLPEGQVLSHDLIEGAMARCAAVTDITVIEEAPFHADVAASRVHRWTRGDWQLLPFLLQPKRYPLRALNRWKMIDNLRRSLVAPMSLALLLFALTGESVSIGMALLLVMAALMAGPLLGAVAGFSPSRDDIAKLHFYRAAAADLVRAIVGGLWLFAQLLQQAMSALDAISCALHRTFISRRHLLQWTTADAAQAQAKRALAALARQHWRVPALAALLALGLLALRTPTPALGIFLCLLWAGSALWTWAVSRPAVADASARLSSENRSYLEAVARDTWRLFERCVTADDRHLPPDNLQVLPHDMLAHRTSPTNIGLYLLSVACARQFGWIGTQDLLGRLEATLATLLTLQRHRGHFLNWYDTQSGAPLLPMYVSTVDSGNLSGHLLALAQACLELARAPYDRSATQHATTRSCQRLAPLLARRARLAPAQRDELRWLLADHRATLASARLDEQALLTTDAAMLATARLQRAAQAFEQLAWQAEFNFLYNRKRNLFHIGYRVEEQQRDGGFYDLLASESRLTSLLAIAKGDVPVRHWNALGRLFFPLASRAGLRSWSGSMFEYLMPSLMLNEPTGSVLHEACAVALQEQIAFVEGQTVPWGISESAYAASDHTLAYQYAAQGVPRLALRRTPPDELVIAPYATALAAQLAPQRAVLNFAALEAMGARGRYGFIDALDFTPARRTNDEAFAPVSTFMAHHQGMSIVALANVLLDTPVRRWGMANAAIEAVSALLHERVPREISMLYAQPTEPVAHTHERRRVPGMLREVPPGSSAVEPTHLLSNGRYNVTLRANGAGASSWGRSSITRWRDDALRDAYGSFFYLRWSGQQQPVSITQRPAPDPAAEYLCIFHADRVCFDALWPELQAHTTVWVSPEDDIEFRQIELRNHSDQARSIELISAFEVALSEARADEAHPAFMNLFVRAQWQAEHQALCFERKPRVASEHSLQLAHFLADTDLQSVTVRPLTDRQRWRGRNQDVSQPQAAFDAPAPMAPDARLELATGLDPVCALSVQLRIAPNAKVRLTFATAASDNAATLHAVIDKYRQHNHVKRASLMSATLAGIRLRALRISPENFVAIQSLTTALVLSLTRRQTRPARSALLACDRRQLWRLGISGERPVILVSAGVPQGLSLLRSVAQALSHWEWGGVACDLVVINAEPVSYLMALQGDINALREQHEADGRAKGGPLCTGFHVVRSDELSSDELSTLLLLARVRLAADGRPLAHHVQEWTTLHERDFEQRHEVSTTALAVLAAPPSAGVPTGTFDAQSGEFRFEVSTDARPLRPWINVLANPDFGAHLSETGGGYSWARNSRLNQLTAWSNDPVADPPAEWFLLQDRKTRALWSVAGGAWGDPQLHYQVAHAAGYSVIRHRRGELEVTATWCVDPVSSVKQVRLVLVNHGHRALALRLIGMVEWMMGARREDRGTVHTALLRQPLAQQKLSALLCTQRERSAGFGDGTAFFGLTGQADEIEDWTCDRRELFDARGRLVVPDHFGQRSGDGIDPCAAIATRLLLAGGATLEKVFLLGYGETVEAASALATEAAALSASTRLTQVVQGWQQLLGASTVRTPDPLFDAMVNRWLLYQTVSCRLWAKSGFYQAGGATGFRDQLQDALALAWAAPIMLRQQIVLAASRQFEAGDVQHWWHDPLGAGVRTHFSDDLLWLAFAVTHYLRSSGDAALLEQRVPFLEGIEIPVGAEDAYFTPLISTADATVYEHAARAIDRSLHVGAHGLPLMGSGDWNDGMNRVGAAGRGESVWLGWFLCQVVADFAPLAYERGDEARALRWEEAALGWKMALNGTAWDGQWFKRAFFDDGQALGASANREARIDLIAQAWSVLSDAGLPDLQQRAMQALQTHLVDPQAGLIRLLDPPLTDALPNAGYIQSYPPGVRENGSQYSHAGVWALMAQARLASRTAADDGARDLAYRYFSYLSPAHRVADGAYAAVYGLEPYAIAGDVYSQPPYVGRGGWSWYTGAAAWLHRAAIESIFGLQQSAQEMVFWPCLPLHWPQAELTLLREARTLRFILMRASASAALAATASEGARLLHVGEALRWRELLTDNCFVIPLLGEGPDAESAP